MALKIDPFEGIIGLPPRSHVSDTMILNSMPVLEITPGKPDFSRGVSLFEINPATTEYDKVLNQCGFTIDHPIKLAYIADNFPTDNFTNDYGETFLQKSTDVVAENLGQIMQITGSETATKGVKKLAEMLTAAGESAGGFIGKGLTGIGEIGAKGALTVEQMAERAKGGGGLASIIGGGATGLNKLLANHRLDFPQIWRNSGYQPQYSITVRLYNPNPANTEAMERYILGPLAVILCLGIPRTTDGYFYNWPFFHKIKSPGIWFLDPGVITSISVIKGGDQQQIAFNQRLAMVDVRIDFTSLFNSFVAEEGDTNLQKRPTVKNYITQLRQEGTHYSRRAMRQESASAAGSPEAQLITIEQQTDERTPQFTNDAAAVRQAGATTTATASELTRVEPQRATVSQRLTSLLGDLGFINV
jgi:hypothetical protein